MPDHPVPRILQNLSIPRPSSGNLKAMAEKDRPIAIFSDFDGTIFLQDTGHVLFDKFGCGPEQRALLDESIGKTKTFRAASEELWGSLNVTLADAIVELKKKLVIDPDFYKFFEWTQENDIPFTVISAGMKPLLRAALDEFLGPEKSAKINIVSNDGEISADGSSWKPIWIHDSPLGHDKALSVQTWKAQCEGPEPKIVFLGDGVSDLAAASEADILFARRGLALEAFCVDNMIPYIPYDRFKDIIKDAQLLVKGNSFHDPEAKERLRKEKLQKLMGFSPLTSGDSPTSKEQPKTNPASFSIAADESSNSEDTEDEEGLVIDSRPPMSRDASLGTIPTVGGKKPLSSMLAVEE